MKKEPAGWGGLRLDHIREMLALGTNLARRIYTPIRSCVQADFLEANAEPVRMAPKARWKSPPPWRVNGLC